MNDFKGIKTLIDCNKEAFEEWEPQAGHQERFLQKLDEAAVHESSEAAQPRKIKFRRTLSKRKNPFWRAVSIPIAATILLLIGMNWLMYKSGALSESVQTDYFANIENPDNPVSVYTVYMNIVGSSITSISQMASMLSYEEYQSFLNTFNNITDEIIPFQEQLPDELSNQEKAEIMKQYYNDRLAGVKYLSKYMADYIK